jgi:hypothetical protein
MGHDVSNVISLFNVASNKECDYKQESPQELIDNWQERNLKISNEFHKNSVYKKQEVLDSMISICNDLYKMAVEAKYKVIL